jgi:membrane protease YdiL (CAAX protease family)
MAPETARPLFRVSIAAIMVFQVCALFSRSALDAALVRHGSDRAFAGDLSYLIVPPILVLLMYPYLEQHRHALTRLMWPRRLTLRLCGSALLLGVIMRTTYWAVLTVLMWTGVVRNEDPAAIAGPYLDFACPPPEVLALSLFVMAFLTPIAEEVINRGFLLHALLPRGTCFSIVASACLFAIMHRPDSYVVTLLIGIFLAVQMLNAGTLWAPILAHAAYNAAAILDWECLQIVWNPPEADPLLASAARIAAPVAISGILLSCFLVSGKAVGAAPPRSPVPHA